MSIKAGYLSILFFLFSTMFCHAQFSKASIDSLNKLSYQDHQKLLKLLKIDSLRSGPSGNPKAANAANTDESLATPYHTLPNALILKNGKAVKNANTWFKSRRLEIIEDFDREVYGRVPNNVPGVTWKIVAITPMLQGTTPVVRKDLIGYVDHTSYLKLIMFL
jgi:hypothetical protein